MAGAGRPVNLWRINDAKANRHGPRHKIAFVRRNPNYAESVKLGKPEHAFKTGKTYAGDWVDNKREGFGAQVRTPFFSLLSCLCRCLWLHPSRLSLAAFWDLFCFF